MALLEYDTKLLIKKRGYCCYQRRVPKKYAHVDARRFVKKSLETKAIDIAIIRRDVLIDADNEYWQALALDAQEGNSVSEATSRVQGHKYKSVTARAMAHNLKYKPHPS